MIDLVLQPEELRLMEKLRLNPKRTTSGSVKGERTTQKKGVSIEFADYREYAEGDDLRHLDWNVYARLGHAVTKTYRDEEDLAVHLLVDVSASMDFGEPTKLAKARKLAAALGIAALGNGDAVYPQWLGREPCAELTMRGRGSFPKLASWLTSQGATGTRSGDLGLELFAKSSVRKGLVIVVSDGMSQTFAAALRRVAAAGHEVWMIQVLSLLETHPDLEGDLKLLDSETSGTAEVTVNSYTLSEYQTNLRAHNEKIAGIVAKSGGRYSVVEAETPLSETVRDVWRREKWLT